MTLEERISSIRKRTETHGAKDRDLRWALRMVEELSFEIFDAEYVTDILYGQREDSAARDREADKRHRKRIADAMQRVETK